MHLVENLTQPDKDILMKSVVFKGLTKDEMSPFYKSCQIQKYHPGQAIMTFGEPGKGLYIILDGKVEVFVPQGINKQEKQTQECNKARIDLLEPGICFGEYSLVDHKKVSATVSALTPTRMYFLASEDFYRIAATSLKIENKIYKNILRLLIERCRRSNEEMEEDAFLIY